MSCRCTTPYLKLTKSPDTAELHVIHFDLPSAGVPLDVQAKFQGALVVCRLSLLCSLDIATHQDNWSGQLRP